MYQEQIKMIFLTSKCNHNKYYSIQFDAQHTSHIGYVRWRSHIPPNWNLSYNNLLILNECESKIFVIMKSRPHEQHKAPLGSAAEIWWPLSNISSSNWWNSIIQIVLETLSKSVNLQCHMVSTPWTSKGENNIEHIFISTVSSCEMSIPYGDVVRFSLHCAWDKVWEKQQIDAINWILYEVDWTEKIANTHQSTHIYYMLKMYIHKVASHRTKYTTNMCTVPRNSSKFMYHVDYD